MSTELMGPLGLALVVAGLGMFFPAQTRLTAAIEELPELMKGRAYARLRGLVGSIVVIALAVAIYLFARESGHGRLGLFVCVGLLALNAVGAAVLRIRWFAELEPPAAIAHRYRNASLLQMAGSSLLFVGCAVYLLRP